MSQSNEYPTSGAESQVLISVLLVDDQKLIGKMVARMLSEELDLRFEHCLDPALALETAERFRPTIILLDLVMPQISGLELLDRFRQRPEYKHMPIIVLSGKEEARTKAEAFARGANDYLVKLPEIVELVARIKHHSKGYINLLQRNAAMEALQESQRKLEIRNRFIRDTFGKFLSDDVVDTVLENPAGVKLGGEQRTVTIMMSDLRGFTSLSERYRAEQVVLLINNYLGVMTDIVLRHHGTIIEFLGDAIFAVFGAPLSKGNDACNAVACAVEMQVAMKEVNDINRAAGLPETEMGIGLNTGEVKELARETANATENIGRQIKMIQAEAQNSVEAIVHIEEIVRRIADSQSVIASAVEEQTATANEMAGSVNEAARGSADIAQSISGVASAAQSIAENAAVTQSEAALLLETATDIHRVLSTLSVH